METLTTQKMLEIAQLATQNYVGFMELNDEKVSPQEKMAYNAGYLKCLRDQYKATKLKS